MCPRAIGIRVEPKQVHYMIVSQSNNLIEVISMDVIKTPQALSTPEKLAHIRNNLYSVLTEYDVTHAGLRTIENNARKIDIFRANVEGVIQELFSNGPLDGHFAGNIVNIAGALGFKRENVKKAIDGKVDLLEMETEWLSLKTYMREAMLVALASLSFKAD